MADVNVLPARRALVIVLSLVLTLAAMMAATTGTLAREGRGRTLGTLYTLSNEAAGNAVLVFDRNRDGSLTMRGSYPTGGDGNGSGLGSQGAVVLSDDGRWLLAVNAGSDQITAFRVTGRGLQRTSTIHSGGHMPISVDIHGSTVYTVNAGAEGNISGFHLDRAGRLTALPNATLPLSGAAVAPAQISFAPDGDKLVVTEKGSNRISVYHVTQRGKASGPVVSDSAAPTPFGFEFDHHGNLIVSEAVGGAPNASVTSAYRINPDGTLSVISAAVPTNQTAACWVAISSDGRFAYVTNTGSGSVSGYTIMRDGAISLDNATAGLTGAGSMPIDASVAGHHLYVLNAGSDTITSFIVNRDGSLTHLGATGDLPASVAGLATR